MTMGRHSSTGPGLIDRLPPQAGWFRPGWLLFNFDIDSARLKSEHKDELDQKIVPWLKFRHGAAIAGLASRTGTEKHNWSLSHLRCQNVLNYLTMRAGKDFPARPSEGYGELKAKEEGQRDNTEDERFRSVVIALGPQRVAPFLPGVVDVTPFDTGIGDDDSVDIGRLLDETGFGVSLAEWLPIARVVELAEQADLPLTVVQGVLAMPLLARDIKNQNDRNGRMQGFWEAMQDMADQYSDPRLSNVDYGMWPALRKPMPRPIPMGGQGLNEKQWMEGKVKGCAAAYETMRAMEDRPEIKNNWKITGRRYLFLLSQKFGKGVGSEFKAKIDRRLIEQGGLPFPVRK